jgi:hypothetical protein
VVACVVIAAAAVAGSIATSKSTEAEAIALPAQSFSPEP